MKYKLEEKEKRAILDQNGTELALFSKGEEELAETVCDLLNQQVIKKFQFTKKRDLLILFKNWELEKNINKSHSPELIADWFLADS